MRADIGSPEFAEFFPEEADVYIDTEFQGDDAWHEDRRGCFTASIFGALNYEKGEFKSGPRKGQQRPPPKSRMDEIDRVIAELLTGRCKERVNAPQFDYGHEMEPVAMAVYEAKVGELVEMCGFIRHGKFEFAGASPDFLVGDEGGGEIKCPMSITVHATTLRTGLPDEHIEQIQGGLWVTGRKWWDFVSYNPHFPPGLDLYVQRVYRDEEVIARIEADVCSAWEEVQQELMKLLAKINQPEEEKCDVER